MAKTTKPRVFIDADVLFAGAAAPSEYGASLVVLRMAEITLVEAIASRQVIIEAERNLTEKFPNALSTFRLLVDRCLEVVADPARDDLSEHEGLADPKDLPILVAAVQHECSWLVTYNTRHFQPGHPDVTVLEPGAFVMRVRELLAYLTPSED
jgi:predicted nucleic acid-binding protein